MDSRQHIIAQPTKFQIRMREQSALDQQYLDDEVESIMSSATKRSPMKKSGANQISAFSLKDQKKGPVEYKPAILIDEETKTLNKDNSHIHASKVLKILEEVEEETATLSSAAKLETRTFGPQALSIYGMNEVVNSILK